MVKNLPVMQETPVQSLGQEDLLEKGMATYSSILSLREKGKATRSSILAWRIPWTVQPMGSQRVRHGWATFTFTSILAWRIPWTEKHGGLQATGSQRVRHNWATNTLLHSNFENLLKRDWTCCKYQNHFVPWSLAIVGMFSVFCV